MSTRSNYLDLLLEKRPKCDIFNRCNATSCLCCVNGPVHFLKEFAFLHQLVIDEDMA